MITINVTHVACYALLVLVEIEFPKNSDYIMQAMIDILHCTCSLWNIYYVFNDYFTLSSSAFVAHSQNNCNCCLLSIGAYVEIRKTYI